MGRGGKRKNRGGGRGGARNHGGGGGGRGGGGWHNHGKRAEYEEIPKTNERYEEYYNELGIVPEVENEDFWDAMRRELPNSFRFTGSKWHALSVQQRLIDHYVPQISAVTYEGQAVEPPKPVEWFPEKLAWSMTTPKNVVRKFPPFSQFQRYLVSETSVGNISRQEIVSMIPPLVMDIRPSMAVLDLCAAPGSKSAQIIEMIHGGEEARVQRVLHQVEREEGRAGSPDGVQAKLEESQVEAEGDWSDDGRSTGILIANDVDYRRAQMLVHQVKRLNSPNLLVTNHDAQHFPSIRMPSKSSVQKYLKFDRILADVPCSGDGTARKNPNVWKDWTPGNAIGLHPMQVRILVRALQMLKIGGRAVYSTCSLNPIENEAVVAAAVDICGGTSKIRLVDCSDQLPGLRRSPGLQTWKVMSKTGQLWSSRQAFEEILESYDEGSREREVLSKLPDTLFPPQEALEGERIPLERCMRVYPHYQDTGGFFIVVLEKLSGIKALEQPRTAKTKTAGETDTGRNGAAKSEEINGTESEDPSKKRMRDEITTPDPPIKKTKVSEDDQIPSLEIDAASALKESNSDVEVASGNPEIEVKTAVNYAQWSMPDVMTSKGKSNQPQEEPFKYLDSDHPELQKIYEFYQLNPRFPRDRYMVRNPMGEPTKAIYYTSVLVRDILMSNEGKGMKFVQAGVKMFMKQDAQGKDICRWRIQTEGMPIVEPWVGEVRVVRLYKRPTLRKLLVEMFIKVSGDEWMELNEIGESVRDIPMGCAVLRVETSDDEDGFKEPLALPIWRSIASVNLMMPKEDRKAMLLRLYNEANVELIDNSILRKKETEAALDESLDDPLKKEEASTADDGIKAEFTDMHVLPEASVVENGIEGVPLGR